MLKEAESCVSQHTNSIYTGISQLIDRGLLVDSVLILHLHHSAHLWDEPHCMLPLVPVRWLNDESDEVFRGNEFAGPDVIPIPDLIAKPIIYRLPPTLSGGVPLKPKQMDDKRNERLMNDKVFLSYLQRSFDVLVMHLGRGQVRFEGDLGG